MREAFIGNAWTMGVFFRYCRKYKVDDLAARINVLRRLTAKKKLGYNRDGDALLKGKKVLKIQPKKDDLNA